MFELIIINTIKTKIRINSFNLIVVIMAIKIKKCQKTIQMNYKKANLNLKRIDIGKNIVTINTENINIGHPLEIDQEIINIVQKIENHIDLKINQSIVPGKNPYPIIEDPEIDLNKIPKKCIDLHHMINIKKNRKKEKNLEIIKNKLKKNRLQKILVKKKI